MLILDLLVIILSVIYRSLTIFSGRGKQLKISSLKFVKEKFATELTIRELYGNLREKLLVEFCNEEDLDALENGIEDGIEVEEIEAEESEKNNNFLLGES